MKKLVALLIAASAVVAALLVKKSRDDAGGTERIDAATLAHLKQFSETVEAGRASATAAFAASSGSEHDALDEKAFADIKRFRETFSEIAEKLPAPAVDLAREIVERYEAAQVQLMTFAINRKNRESNEDHVDMETADRSSFANDSAQLSERLGEAIRSRRV